MANEEAIIAIGIFLITYAFIISEKIHRTIVAMIGGVLMVLFGVVDQETALHHIDFNTLGLLTGMMIIVTITAETGLFKFIAIWAAKKVKGHPMAILIVLSLITAVGSAFLDNVTTVLLMVPVTFSITRRLGITPMPFLISEILMSNIGGTATMIGDPPNIMIGSAVKELSFMDFITNLAPVIIITIVVVMLVLTLIYRKHLYTDDKTRKRIMDLNEKDEITDKPLMIKAITVMGLTILGFFLHQAMGVESATIALAGAFLLLLLSGEHYLEGALSKVEWTTIFFFVGLFVLVSGLVETGVIERFAVYAIDITGGNVTASSILILWMSAIASAFVDNIPYVATMIPLVQQMGELGINNLEPLWWSLALGACLGGNGTLIGASANVIVSGLAGKEGYRISFLKFMAIGLPIMFITVAISTVYIYLRYLI
ncbi:Na+/H+ antiporter NhaD/arsenite permease-like protein [Scopulibacillus darangshiensis]|uniref:Na+/H+ antiporter NhaD/arsenite permease-like protein n=1 Tax=Scopulibacillus darangshiensis TaxID=442528 RepID=A0A4R2P3U3_9BACL|nr:ArsB/NhaD family transporter [Scopulibacillus darangshiensis]TCP28714.1 Na+/H+ antiporter NhaD/arsenite permease-like protein [Scopulibacillus darangshiensis]